MKLAGKITKILANFYYVCDDTEKIWECFARARLLKEGKHLLVGDVVDIETTIGTQAVIVELHERNNKLDKPPVANIDQVLVVFSTCEPDFDFYNLDRYLSFVRYNLPAQRVMICMNKIDLKRIDIDRNYGDSNFDIWYVSALTKEGVDKLAEALALKTTVLTGPSGVGKSSLINVLVPGENIEVGSLSRVKKGKHITRGVQLISVDKKFGRGFLADTPGFTQLDFASFDPLKVLLTFNELSNLGCGFGNCLHRPDEEGCILQSKESLTSVVQSRYMSYLRILEEIETSEVTYSAKKETRVKLVGDAKNAKNAKSTFLPKIDRTSRLKSRRKEKQELLRLKNETDS